MAQEPKKAQRSGYTTGSCAAGAAKAAAQALLGGAADTAAAVEVRTPSGTYLRLLIEDLRCNGEQASCAVRKDAGDDPDVTHGVLVYALVEKRPEAGIALAGGEGIGRVTLPGLDAPVGEAAINKVPRAMIQEHVQDVCGRYGYTGGLRVTVSIPGGGKIAERTFNPKLGIKGGLSILGTTGIVEPMSDRGLLGTIRAEFSVRRAGGETGAVITPGNYGIRFLAEWGRGAFQPVKCGNFIGDSLDMARELGFTELLVAGHVGKLIKLAAGNFNTHSKYGDPRLEILTAYAGLAGAGRALMGDLMGCVATEQALTLLEGAGLWEEVRCRIFEAIQAHLTRRAQGGIKARAALFSSSRGFLGFTAEGCFKPCG